MHNPWLMLVDGHYFLHSSMRVPQLGVMCTLDGRPTGGIFGFLSSIKKSLDVYPSIRRVVVSWDTDRSLRRLKILPSYKNNREPNNDEEREEREKYNKRFEYQSKCLKDNLFSFGIRQAALPVREGDDIIALMCRLYNEIPKLIVTEDKDIFQLVDENTIMYRPFREEEVNFENFDEITGAVDIPRFLVTKAILGDTSDNIPNIPKVGKKTVESLMGYVNRCEPPVDSIGAINLFMEACEHAPKTKSGKMQAKIKSIYDSEDHILRNLDLVDMSFEKFNEDEENAIRYYVEGGQVTFNRDKSLRFLTDVEFKSMIKYFSIFDNLFGQLR